MLQPVAGKETNSVTLYFHQHCRATSFSHANEVVESRNVSKTSEDEEVLDVALAVCVY